MGHIKKVLIIGRPNVGKSTLLNRIIGKRKSITAEETGVTRDVQEHSASWNGKSFQILDSGGLLLHKGVEIIQSKIESQVFSILEEVDKIIFLVDSRSGLTSVDDTIATILRKHHDNVFLVVNKCDNPESRSEATPFYKCGYGDPYPVSGLQGFGVADLLDDIVASFSEDSTHEDRLEEARRIAIVGRPNIGKSSLLNALVNQTKAIVHDESGTTRDSIEVLYRYHDRDYIFVDTAGIRRRSKIRDTLEYFSILRSDRSIEIADLVVVVLDSTFLITDQDKKVINFVLENKRNMILFVNKWDLMDRTDLIRKDLIRLITDAVPVLEHYPILFGSATERLSLGKLVGDIASVIDESNRRVTTSELNRFINDVMLRNPPKSKKGKRLVVYYATQAEIGPPTFVFFVNDGRLITMDYRRFLERQLRAFFGGMKGPAMRLKFKSKSDLKSNSIY